MMKFLSLFSILLLLNLFGHDALSQSTPQEDKKLFSFGAMADVQYADIDQVGKRYYRGSLQKLENSIQLLNQYELSFIASLGDLIDRDFNSFEQPLQLMTTSKTAIHHVLGNHEFMVEDQLKKKVAKLLENPKRYYSFEKDGFVMVMLNGMEESIEAYPKGSKKYKKGMAVYQRLQSEGANNAQTYNGGLGKKQLKWLGKVLKRAGKKHKKVIFFCHFPLLPENGLQLWDNREVLDMIDSSKSVVAYFSGHHHSGNYVVNEGIHHLTFKGIVEAEADASFGIIDVYPDRLSLKGFGDQEDQVMGFRE